MVSILCGQFAEQRNWRLAKDDEAAYVQLMVCRVMNLAHSVRQGQQRHPNAKWVQELLGAAGVKDEGQPAAADYAFGYDRELRQAWRAPMNSGAKIKKEHSVKIFVSGTDCVAEWHDSQRWVISGLTVAEWNQQQKGGVQLQCIWQGEHHATHDRLIVRFRKDRDPKGLTSLYEQGSQICQVLNRMFTDAAAAGVFMKDLAEAYARGDFPKERLKPECRERLDKMGFGNPRKRPVTTGS